MPSYVNPIRGSGFALPACLRVRPPCFPYSSHFVQKSDLMFLKPHDPGARGQALASPSREPYTGQGHTFELWTETSHKSPFSQSIRDGSNESNFHRYLSSWMRLSPITCFNHRVTFRRQVNRSRPLTPKRVALFRQNVKGFLQDPDTAIAAAVWKAI